jgi:hypothetical protein
VKSRSKTSAKAGASRRLVPLTAIERVPVRIGFEAATYEFALVLTLFFLCGARVESTGGCGRLPGGTPEPRSHLFSARQDLNPGPRSTPGPLRAPLLRLAARPGCRRAPARASSAAAAPARQQHDPADRREPALRREARAPSSTSAQRRLTNTRVTQSATARDPPARRAASETRTSRSPRSSIPRHSRRDSGSASARPCQVSTRRPLPRPRDRAIARPRAGVSVAPAEASTRGAQTMHDDERLRSAARLPGTKRRSAAGASKQLRAARGAPATGPRRRRRAEHAAQRERPACASPRTSGRARSTTRRRARASAPSRSPKPPATAEAPRPARSRSRRGRSGACQAAEPRSATAEAPRPPRTSRRRRRPLIDDRSRRAVRAPQEPNGPLDGLSCTA